MLPLDEVIARVREAAQLGRRLGRTGPLITDAIPLSAYAPERNNDPYAGFEPRIVPENVTLLPKTTEQVTGGNAWNERTVVLKKGDSVSANPARHGRERRRDQGDHRGVRWSRQRQQPQGRLQAAGPARPGYATACGCGRSGSSSRPTAASRPWWHGPTRANTLPWMCAAPTRVASSSSDDDEDDGKGVRLYQSIYETALRNHVPRPVIDDLIRIYSYDVDFQRKVQPGDSFEILFASDDENASDNSKAEVLFASLTTGGETRKFYRYQTTDDNVVDYYDESGKSAKKFLVRKPVADGTITSGFGGRNHPLLGFMKMHTGVDWASHTGTPIFASGNGMIEKIGLEGGYGKYIRIRHANGWETAYGHMSAFARGMEAGKTRPPGSGDRVCGLDRALDRRASALRDPGERPLRRPDEGQAAARPRARRNPARRLRSGARAAGRHAAACTADALRSRQVAGIR